MKKIWSMAKVCLFITFSLFFVGCVTKEKRAEHERNNNEQTQVEQGLGRMESVEP
jgi:Tfp pilus assembly protein PilF